MAHPRAGRPAVKDPALAKFDYYIKVLHRQQDELNKKLTQRGRLHLNMRYRQGIAEIELAAFRAERQRLQREMLEFLARKAESCMQEARDESPLGPGDEAEHAALIERQGAAKRDLDYRTRRNRINIVRRKRDIATLRLEGMWVVRGYNKAMADLGGGVRKELCLWDIRKTFAVV